MDRAFAVVEENAALREIIYEVRKDAGPQIGVVHGFLKAFRNCTPCEFHSAAKRSELHTYAARTWTELYHESGVKSTAELSRLLAKAERAKWIVRTNDERYQLTEEGKYADVSAENLMPMSVPEKSTEEVIEEYRREKARKMQELREKQRF